MGLETSFETGRLRQPIVDLSAAKRDIQTAFITLTGLRGYWPMSSISSVGKPIDMSNAVNNLNLNGSPLYNSLDDIPYIEFPTSSDYLSFGDTAGHDILGTESYINSARRGLTLGGWFYHSSLSGAQAYIAKYGDSGNISYAIRKTSAGAAQASMSSNGTSIINASGISLVISTWYFIVGRFNPASSVNLFVNAVKSTQATAVASLYNSSVGLHVGQDASAVSRALLGRAALCFLCAAALPDEKIESLFQMTRELFGV